MLAFALLLAAAGRADAQFEPMPIEAPLSGLSWAPLELPSEGPNGLDDALADLPTGRALLSAAEEELPSEPLPPAARPVEGSTPREAASIFRRLFEREALAPAELARLEALLDRAGRSAFDSELPVEERLEAVTFLARVALLSYHDLPSHRLAENWLVRLKFSLCRVHQEAEDAWVTVYRERWRPMAPETRRFLLDSLSSSPLALNPGS